MWHQLVKNRLLDGFILGRCLDHQIGCTNVGQIKRGDNLGEGGGFLCGGDFCANNLPIEVAFDLVKPACQLIL